MIIGPDLSIHSVTSIKLTSEAFEFESEGKQHFASHICVTQTDGRSYTLSIYGATAESVTVKR